MKRITPSQFTQALSKQNSLTDAQWLKRCDELAVQQPVLFTELQTFSRDGVPENIFRRLIDYLSVLQFVTKEVSESASAPISLPEFQAATKRAQQFFYATKTDDPAHLARMTKAWFEGLVEKGNISIWALCVETLHSSSPDIS